MPRLLIMLLVLMMLIVGCEEDVPQQFSGPQFNEFSSQWAGNYNGLVCISQDPDHDEACEQRQALVRVYDVGENHIRLQIFSDPRFAPAQETLPDVLVTSGTYCSRIVDDHELYRYLVSMTRGGDVISGRITAVHRESGRAEWVVSIQNCSRGKGMP